MTPFSSEDSSLDSPPPLSRVAQDMISELKFLVPWGHIAAKAWGPPQGRPVLCLHGWLDNANTFDRLIPLLPKDCYYTAIDFGGHGLSSHRPPGFPYHFFDYVGDVRRVVAELKWNRFTLMGHSLGGSVAGMFSCIFPDMVDKLILVESYGFFPAPKDYGLLLKSKRKLFEDLLSFEANKRYSPKARSPQEALQRLLEANPHLTEDSGKILLQRGTTEVPGGLVYNRDVRISLHNHSFVTLDQCLIFLKKIQADVLMIIAQDGIFSIVSEEMPVVKPLQEAYKTFLKERFQYVSVSGNHFVHLNEPEVVAGIISTFLSKNEGLKASL
ncbi:serine hydrolase-like protein 2 isoform X3 [Eublepharis macularius]|uniref:Serine hydrolase-like protein 2 isoform X3 n=1 Tax=Eublepharis macularius TaxID=481883 RepID=A0AA97JVB0_EUBMA|nr:serine hydrolase-like protein 2 isoform X3 [Eublepharis macularius]